MAFSDPVATIRHPVRVVDGRQFLIEQLVWPSGQSSFDVSLIVPTTPGNAEEHDLTPDASCPTMPTDDEIRGLHEIWRRLDRT